jgi:hypothetical protein
MRCPLCLTEGCERPKKGPRAWRNPVEREGMTWRVHECRSCRKIFVSVQQALSAKDAAAWAAHFEPLILPESGSTSGPETTSKGETKSQGPDEMPVS